MLKSIFLAGAMTIAMPAFAQTQPAPTDPAPVTDATPADASTAGPQDSAASTQTAPGTPMTTEAVPASEPQVAQAAPAAEPAAAAPASKAEQVAAVVNTEFPSYDKDSNGSLSNAEFGAWMVALKTASDPATKASAPATKTWVGKAFASADKDKSKSVTKEELTGFLAQG